MNRNENLTVHPNGPERPLRDEELEAVNGGTIRALGGPDTRLHYQVTMENVLVANYQTGGSGHH
jgi:hypothetical protein